MLTRLIIQLILLATLVNAPRAALAQTAGELYTSAERRFNEADFEEAVDLLERAARGTKDRALLAKIQLKLGIIRAVLGETDRAKAAFTSALKLEPTLTLSPQKVKPEVVDLLEGARAKLEGILSVDTDVPGAQVWVDNKLVGKAPHVGSVTVGRHVIKVQLAAETRTRNVVVSYISNIEVRFTFKVQPQAKPAAEPPPAVAAKDSTRRGSLLHMPGVLTWISLGLAVGALGAGVGLGASAVQDYSEFEDLLANGPRDEQRRQELADGISAKGTAANALYGVAGGLAAVSVLLYFVEDRIWSSGEEEDRQARATRQLVISPLLGQTVGLGIDLRF